MYTLTMNGYFEEFMHQMLFQLHLSLEKYFSLGLVFDWKIIFMHHGALHRWHPM